MSVVINQEYVSFADILNVKWRKEVAESCHSRGIDGLDDRYIVWNNTPFTQAIEWTNEKVDQVFTGCCPRGLDQEVMSILDQGYSIFVSDNGMNVRLIWIEKVDGNDKPIEQDEQRLFGRALQFESLLKRAIDIFQQTLSKGQPFKYEDWFGSNKKYCRHIVGAQVADSRLDGFFALATHRMIFRKAHNGYELVFDRDDIYERTKKRTIIVCKRFVIA